MATIKIISITMFLFVTVLLGAVLTGGFYLLKWIKLHTSNYIKMTELPGPPRQGFLIGNMSYLQTTPENLMLRLREAAKKYYPIYKLFAMHGVGANIVNPEDSEIILSNPNHNQKSLIYKLLHNWLRDGLLTSTGPKWQTRRKILTPAFHFSILQTFVQVLNEEADELVEVLKKESAKSYVNVTPHITQFTLKTIAQTAMGTKLKFETEKEIAYKQAVYDVGQILLYRLLHPWLIFFNILSPWYLRERKITGTLQKFTREVIKEREKNFTGIELPKNEDDVYKGKKRLAMLDLLISAKREGLIDDSGIQEEVDTFMFEGHDTTASGLSFMLMLLACNGQAQDLIRQEMTEILEDVHKKPTYHDLQNLKYLERCIKESLRLYPSVFFFARTLGEDVHTHSGYFLPKQTNAIIHVYDIHRNPDIYPDPEKFDPDRFLPENSQNRHPFAYLPFSAGPRNCIGQKFAILELKAAVCAILANFVLQPIDTPETIVLVADIILRSKEGVKVKFVPRV